MKMKLVGFPRLISAVYCMVFLLFFLLDQYVCLLSHLALLSSVRAAVLWGERAG